MTVNGYIVSNVCYSNKYVDLDLGKVTAGTKVIAYYLGIDPQDGKTRPWGNANQQWRFDPVPAGKNLYTIRNVCSGTYAGFEGNAAAGTCIGGYDFSTVFELVTPKGYVVNKFIIKVPYSDLVWVLDNGADGTQIKLAKSDGSTSQQWGFKTIV